MATDHSSKLLKAFATRRFAISDSELSEVIPSLFISSIGGAENADALQSCGITHVLSLGSADMLSRLEIVNKLALTHLALELNDKADVDLSEVLPQSFNFISTCVKNGGKVLVHCFQGKSRSVGVVAAYIMETEGLTYVDALELIRKVRPRACPNVGFALQLRRLQKLNDKVAL